MALESIGYWSEVKLDIVRLYGAAYSRILSAQSWLERHIYIDAFAGAGKHESRTSGEVVPGSPLQALSVDPPFAEYHFIDLDRDKVQLLEAEIADHPMRGRVHLYAEDCNEVLPEKVFPRAQHEHRRRALCLLDPYGLHLSWEIIHTAGQMRSVEIFLNFPTMDINMNVLRRNPESVAPDQAMRMTRFWGDDSWRQTCYTMETTLFGPLPRRRANEEVAEIFRERLRERAGFSYVPQPMAMRNSTNAIVYYLFFASPNRVGAKIVGEIFDKHRDRTG